MFFGLALGLVGIDLEPGQARYTLGLPQLRVLVPLLTLGLPTWSAAAIMLAAFQQFNLQPGPLIFTANPELVWGLIASLHIDNVMLLLLNLPRAARWARPLRIPAPLL